MFTTMILIFKNKISHKLMLLLTLTLIIVGVTNALAAQESKFTAGLTGQGESPPLVTEAQGSGEFRLLQSDEMIYEINVTNIHNLTRAQIHLGKHGLEGPVIATLFSTNFPISYMSGILSRGNLTYADLEGPMKGHKLSDLINLIKSGEVYINILTQENPKGEVRGQIGLEGTDESNTTLGETSNNDTLPKEIE